jgi:hypothetical protein
LYKRNKVVLVESHKKTRKENKYARV